MNTEWAATMRFKCAVTVACWMMLSAVPVAADDADSQVSARSLMHQAHNARAVWENFPGFAADITVRNDDQTYSGTIQVAEDLEYQLDLPKAAGESWLKSKLRSVISHRRSREFSDDEFSFVNDRERTGPGKLVARGDGSGVFRIVDGVITEVHRRSETSWLEISNLELVRTADGRVLPRTTSVTYRNPESGDVISNRSNIFEWTRVGAFDLPRRTLTVETGEGGKRSVRELIFTNHKLASPADVDDPRVVMHTPLPETLTSFGAAVLNDYLYVFSGHSGDAHGFGNDLLVKSFRRIRFDDPEAEWEELAKQPPAQSTAIVTDGQYIYRIAGLSFLNSDSETTNFNSTSHFSRYDPKTDKWTQLEPLPEPRSSLDAAVLGRSIYVAGGWNLQGESSGDAPWHETILRYDLDKPDSGWQTLEGPGYKTRAASVAAYQGKLYLLGGIQPRGITRKVSIYDPSTNEWSEGPEIRPDASTAGFATSAFATGGRLYYTGGSGVVYRLKADGSEWEIADRLMFPRIFLRLLPASDNRLLALGGTGGMTGRTAVVESIRVDDTSDEQNKIMRWSIPYAGRARHSQTLLLDGVKLYAFGGNASPEPHDFSKDAFVSESFVFDLTRQRVEQLPDIPVPMQSGAAVVVSKTSEHSSFAITGGMGHVDDRFQALSSVLEFNPDARTWQKRSEVLPQPRAMHSAVAHEDAVWIFGGSLVGADRRQLNSILHWWGDDSDISPLPNEHLPTPRRSFGAAVLDGRLYLAGGLTAESGIAETIDVFNFEDRTWNKVASPSVSRVFPSLVATKDRLYLFGGFAESNGHFAPATSLEVFNPDSKSWSTVAQDLPGVDASMTMFSLSGRLLFYGISDDGKAADFVLFDPAPQTDPGVVETMSFTRRDRDAEQDAKQNARILLRKDADKDGRLSADELGHRMSVFFRQADTNTDSYITLTEAVAALKAEAEKQDRESESDTSNASE